MPVGTSAGGENLPDSPWSTWPGMARLRSTNPACCEVWPTRHWIRSAITKPSGTTSKTGRALNVHPQHPLLAAARRASTDPAWQAEYSRWRPPVERAIAWPVARGNRRVPYRGIAKNNTWLHHRAAALNLRRLVNLGLTRTGDGTWALA